jgi:catechol 2,3-dioxygenase-like lactoylglutathione lyase family enzyme
MQSKIKAMSPQFLVSDLDRSIEFYTNKLGFEESFRYEGFYSGIHKDGHSIHLKLARPIIEERVNKRNNEHLDITFSVEDIENVYEEILSNSIEVIQSLRDMPYGKEFYIADPDGHIIAFLETHRAK